MPLAVEDVTEGRSIEIKLKERMKRDKIVPKEHIRRRAAQALSSIQQAVIGEKLEEYEWPPKEVVDACEYIPGPAGSPGAYICTYWKLRQIYFSAVNTTVPVVIADVHGEYMDDVRAIDHVILRLHIESSKALGISIAFGAIASLGLSGGASVDTEYEFAGFTMVLDDDRVWLDYYHTWIEGEDFYGDTLFALGFYGDVAYANYVLEACVYTVTVECEEIGEGNLTLARPVIVEDSIIPWHDKDDYPYDNDGIIEEVYWRFHSLWALSGEKVETTGLYIDVLQVKDEIDTIPLFALTVPVVPLASGGLPVIAELSLGASLGIVQERFNLLYAAAIVTADSSNTGYVIAGRYIYSPMLIEHNNDAYHLGTLFVDFEARKS